MVSADLAIGTVLPGPVLHRRLGAGHVVGIDLGGTKLLAGIADAEGNLLSTCEEPTRHGDGAPVLQQIVDIVAVLTKGLSLDAHDIAGLVIGVPSAVSPSTGLSSLSPNLALPADQPLSHLLGERLPFPVTVENDVNLAAYGEAKAANLAEGESLVFISFGTGVGMGYVVDGRLVRGAFGRAGEIAYLPLGNDPHAEAPASENGLFEDRVGTAAIRQRFAMEGASVAELFTRARSGDVTAGEAIDTIARWASVGVASVQALMDPARIVIGGGIGSQDLFLERLQYHLAPLLPFPCPVNPSRFGARAGLIGAISLAADLVSRGPFTAKARPTPASP